MYPNTPIVIEIPRSIYRGKLSIFPINIVKAIIREHFIQYGGVVYYLISSWPQDSFCWSKTKNGMDYWSKLFAHREYDQFDNTYIKGDKNIIVELEKYRREYYLKEEQIVLSGEKQIYTPFF